MAGRKPGHNFKLKTVIMGWRKDAKKRMRQQRQMARLSKKQAKKLGRIYKNMSPEEIAEMNKIAPEIGVAQTQLDEGASGSLSQGQVSEPISTMAEYNDIYGTDDSEESMFDEMYEYIDAEDMDGEGEADDEIVGSISQLGGGVMGLIDRFRNNFCLHGNLETLESVENVEHAGWIKNTISKLSGKDENGNSKGGKHAETINEIAKDIQIMYPKKAKQLKKLAAGGSGHHKMIIGILVGAATAYVLMKFVFKK